MATYMIHTMPKRMWYVRDFLIPAMLKQGIAKENIIVYNDIEGAGTLQACLDSFSKVGNDTNGTWHLQDDVVISSDFKEKTEQYDSGIVCGFASEYDKSKEIGLVKPKDMWYSFLCIRIPNFMAKNFVVWFNEEMRDNPVYKAYWKDGTNDDLAFKMYIRTLNFEVPIRNLVPNIVNHVDYMIGGQVRAGAPRDRIITSKYWEDEAVIEWLRDMLQVLEDE